MRTARSSSRPGSLHQAHPPGTRHPADQAPPRPGIPQDQAPPWDQAPPRPDPPRPGTPGTRHPPERSQAPPGSRHAHPWTEFLTHACKNITLPQASFAGGNKILWIHLTLKRK